MRQPPRPPPLQILARDIPNPCRRPLQPHLGPPQPPSPQPQRPAPPPGRQPRLRGQIAMLDVMRAIDQRHPAPPRQPPRQPAAMHPLDPHQIGRKPPRPRQNPRRHPGPGDPRRAIPRRPRQIEQTPPPGRHGPANRQNLRPVQSAFNRLAPGHHQHLVPQCAKPRQPPRHVAPDAAGRGAGHLVQDVNDPHAARISPNTPTIPRSANSAVNSVRNRARPAAPCRATAPGNVA